MALRIIIGLGLTLIAFAIAGRRLWWLYRLAMTGQPAPERIEALKTHPGKGAETQVTEVFGQRKLLQWTVPGIAHFLTFWGFVILLLTILEAYGDLFSKTFAIPGIGHWTFIGFVEDLFAVAVLAGIAAFAVIRLRNNPKMQGRASRFSGSHTGAAWFVLLMIFGVIATLLIYRGAQINTGDFPYAHGAFASQIVGHWLSPLSHGANMAIETTFVLAQLGMVLAFLAFLVHSKHLHIAIAPLNVLFSRRPNGLRALEPMRSNGKVLDFEEADPDTDVFGIGKIEDLTWKGMLDLGTCTECGRCQSQCPAWLTDKPLSPKMLILDLRDHAFAKAPYLLASSDEARAALPDAVKHEAERPLVGTADANGVIDPDVLWSCTNCGACVHECPVDIEHIDHIAGMRRHQVLIESQFPAEASGMLKNLENKGDPWGMGESKRTEWMADLDFEVPVVDGTIGDDVEYLFWVGCAGALGGQGQEDHQGDRPAPAHGRGFVRGTRARRDVHRRPGAADGERVCLLDARAAEHRDAERRRSQEGHRELPALLQHDRERVPPARRQLRGDPPHPVAVSSCRRGQAQAGQPDRREDHLSRPVLPRKA